MKNHSKSIVVIILTLLMAISAPDAFAQGRVTRQKKQSTTQTQKPSKKKQKKTQTKPKPTQQSQKPEQESKPLTGFYNGHEWVDLGLPSGLKWATCNVGASSPEDYGDYFSWGETRAKSEYSGQSSVTYDKSVSELISEGIINGSGILTKSHDAASANWGSLWRMPTKAECEELVGKCTWTWTTQGGATGYKVTGPNGNSIFLPAAGRRIGSSLNSTGENGYYWSSSVYDDSYGAYCLDFSSGGHFVGWGSRYFGFSVRPVSE